MRSIYHLLVAGIFALLLTGCDSEALLDEAAEKIAPDHIRELATQVGDMVLAQDAEGLKAVFHPSVTGPGFDAAIANLWTHIPGGAHTDTSLAGLNARSHFENGVTYADYSFQYQYGFEEGWLLVQMIFREQDDVVNLTKLNLTPLDGDLREINKFNFGQASVVSQFLFLLVIAIPALIIFTFVVAFRMRKSLKRPKRWMLFILFGIGSLTLNWTTGETAFEPLRFGLLGAGFLSSGPHAPLILKIYFPLGMVLFWIFKQTGNLAPKVPEQKIEEILE